MLGCTHRADEVWRLHAVSDTLHYGCAWWYKFGADICGHAKQHQGPNYLQIVLQVQVHLAATVEDTKNNELVWSTSCMHVPA